MPDPNINWEAAIGSGERCIPGDETNCGDEGPALAAKLAYPKGIYFCQFLHVDLSVFNDFTSIASLTVKNISLSCS